MSAREPGISGRYRSKVQAAELDRPEVSYQRQRHSPERLNNSTRRTYDLLRSTLATTARNVVLVEQELVDAFSASRSTVRTVLRQLAREGLVTREPKNGTRSTGWLIQPIDELVPGEARTLDCRLLGCPPVMRERLNLPTGWTILMIESLVMADGFPLGLAVSYIALDEKQSPDLNTAEPDVILILERQLGVQIGESRTTVGAIIADKQTAELIGVGIGAPLIWLEDVIADETGQPRALSQLRLRGDRIAFSVKARRSA